jgi:hypothetical protein
LIILESLSTEIFETPWTLNSTESLPFGVAHTEQISSALPDVWWGAMTVLPEFDWRGNCVTRNLLAALLAISRFL